MNLSLQTHFFFCSSDYTARNTLNNFWIGLSTCVLSTCAQGGETGEVCCLCIACVHVSMRVRKTETESESDRALCLSVYVSRLIQVLSFCPMKILNWAGANVSFAIRKQTKKRKENEFKGHQ